MFETVEQAIEHKINSIYQDAPETKEALNKLKSNIQNITFEAIGLSAQLTDHPLKQELEKRLVEIKEQRIMDLLSRVNEQFETQITRFKDDLAKFKKEAEGTLTLI